MAKVLAFFPAQPATGPIVRRQGTLFLPFHAVRSRPPPSEWRTDEDVFGMLVLEDGAARLEVHPIPQRFPEQDTGARGARRELEFLGETAHQLLFLLESPFGVAPWGTRRLLYAFELGERRWRRFECPERGARRIDPLAETNAFGDPASGEHLCGVDVEWPELGGTVHLAGAELPFRPTLIPVPREALPRRSPRVDGGRLLLERSGATTLELGPWPELISRHLGPGAKDATPWSAAETSWKGAPAIVLTLRTQGRAIDDPLAALLVLARPPEESRSCRPP